MVLTHLLFGREFIARNFYVVIGMVSSCLAKFFVNSAQRSTCSEQRDLLTRHAFTYKKFKNVRPKSGGGKVT